MQKFTAVLLMIISLMVADVYAVNSTVEGIIKDADTGEELIGANVILLETSLGASTDVEGHYEIRAVPPGTYKIKASYIGYTVQELEITVGSNTKVVQDFNLTSVAVMSEEVVITSQAEGQLEAINRQLSTDQIINAVSAARIQELPDANAAESVSRLPGVSLVRSGGEGEQVVIRGLAPKFNDVTINGVKLASSNADDRSVDLSMISSNSLAGIQVSKTATADMDANVVGGVVNFDLREAQSTSTGAPIYSFLVQGSYKGLENAFEKFNNYKFVATAENRFMDGLLGIFIQGSFEQRNLSDNELAALYGPQGSSEINYVTQNITLDAITRDRKRTNGALTIDYLIPDGKIMFSNFLSTSNTKVEDRQQFFNIRTGTTQNTSSFVSNYSKGTLNTISNILSYDQGFPLFNVKATLSHSYSETKAPKDWTVNFLNPNANLGQFANKENLDPRDIVRAVENDTSEITLNTITTNYRFTRERILTGALDFEVPWNVSDLVSSIFKFGGKYHYLKRSNDVNVINGEPFGLASGTEIIRQLVQAFPWFRTKPGDNTKALIGPFVDPDYDYGEFLNGEYQLVYPLDFDRLHQIVDYVYNNQLPENITYNYNIGSSIINDYWGQEDVAAFYAMATVKVGQFLTIIPGIRYQQLKTVYTAAQGMQGPNPASDYPYELITITEYHPYWLPDLMIRYKPLDWFDVRLAYSNTLSYADYSSITPRVNVALSGGTIAYNGFRLKPTRSVNYDVYFSFYENTIGLFTAGAFLKQITDLIYPYVFNAVTPAQSAPYYPSWYTGGTQGGLRITKYLNNPYKIDNYGMELDWQTHFWYLPGVLSGLVLNVNYTHIFSKAEYPFEHVNTLVRPARYTDSSFFAPLLYQPDNILNVALGYDYKGFSIRISSLYSAKIFTGPTQWDQLLASTDEYNRWDIAVKQELPIKGLKVFCNINNINTADDRSIISASTGVPTRVQSYGYMLELGMTFQVQ